MEENKRRMLVVTRLADLPTDRLEGAIDSICDRCAEPVSLAPSSQALIAEYPNTFVFCGICVPAILQADVDNNKQIEVAAATVQYPGLEPELPPELKEIAEDPDKLREAFKRTHGVREKES